MSNRKSNQLSYANTRWLVVTSTGSSRQSELKKTLKPSSGTDPSLIHCLLLLQLFVGFCVFGPFLFNALSSFTIISLRKRELAA